LAWLSSGDAAVALRPYQLARRCLTNETVDSDVIAGSTVLQRSSAPANCWGTLANRARARWQQGRLRSQHCNVCGKMFPWQEHVCRHSEHKHHPGGMWQVATTCTISVTPPHLLAHSSPCIHVCPPAGFGYTSPSGCMTSM